MPVPPADLGRSASRDLEPKCTGVETLHAVSSGASGAEPGRAASGRSPARYPRPSLLERDVASPDQPENGITHLSLSGWRQFEDVDLHLHPRLTVLTGANASGKTTILSVLAKHLAWQRNFYSSPGRRSSKRRRRDYRRKPDTTGWAPVGTIRYSNGIDGVIRVPPEDIDAAQATASGYDLQIENQQDVRGLYITSHRTVSSYTSVGSIPTVFGGAESMLQQFISELRNRAQGGYSSKSAFAWFKESLIALAVFGEGNASVEPNPEALQIWHGYQQILRLLMPRSLLFRGLRVRSPEILVETEGTSFILDESSGGLLAIMEFGWQIFLESRGRERFTVLFDEPENHLHPSLQRSLIPQLLEAFPRVQFIVASRSPFVVTAVPDSNVYVLDRDENRFVNAELLDQVNKAASADETLKRVLGLDSTMPMWAERRFDEVVGRYSQSSLDSSALDQLRAELVEAGLGAQFPQAMLLVAKAQTQAERS